MKLPKLMELQTTRQLNDVFYGYNHNLRIAEGEFYDMKNMTGDNFPVLSPRRKRGNYIVDTSTPRGLIDKDALCYVDGGDFVINGQRVSLGLTVETDDEGKVLPKRLVSMGKYVIIMPDKKYVNTNDFESDHGDIEAHFKSSGTVSFKMSMMDGTIYETVSQPIAPTITDDMLNGSIKIPAWIDTSSNPNQFKIYSTATETWSTVATTYVKIGCSGIGAKFKVGDAVTISDIEIEAAKGLNVSTVISSCDTDYIVVSGIISTVAEQNGTPIKVVRAMPKMDYICESGNRLWGCRYGVANNGQIVNEIYASKLGDFKNWNSFQGTAADSYAVTVGTDGAFTGAVTHLGYPIFFKENYMHKIYGNYPANYQVQTTSCRGVQRGCADSIAIVNEIVYYKARSGVVAYDGSLPTEISSALGDEQYSKSVAGYLGNKYYISMCDSKGDYHMFVYDTKRATWHREDSTQAVAFCNRRGDLYYIDSDTNFIVSVNGDGVIDPNPVEWEVISGLIGVDSPDKKYISCLDIRMKLDVGSLVSFFAEYDSSGEWEHLFNMTGNSVKSFAIPVRPKRCDHMRLKITGVGDAKIFSICKTIEGGSNT